ncbi:MAG: hypothetical protein HY532_01910 [Chloroflexi bacterium]|nr:hypothetical protein [Chloroflexota bacterium]
MNTNLNALVHTAGNNVKARPLVYALAFLGAVLLTYYAPLGWRYWQASTSLVASQAQIGRLTTGLAGPAPNESALQQETADQQRQLASLQAAFTYPNQDAIFAHVLVASHEVGLSLVSAKSGEPALLVDNGVQYLSLSLDLTFEGGTDRVYAYIAAFQRQVPSGVISNLRINGLEGTPVTQVYYLLYLSPQPAPKSKGPANAPTPSSGR